MATSNFDLSTQSAMDISTATRNLKIAVQDVAVGLSPFFGLIAVAAIIGSVGVGGWNMSFQALAPDLKKMDPIAGIKKRLFSISSLVELLKAIGKFVVVAVVAILVIYFYFPRMLSLSKMSLDVAVSSTLNTLVFCYLFIVLSVLVIVFIDVPFQIWNHTKSLKMTKDEVKREMKDTEGKPEVKSKVRQLQREMAQRRMMGNVPEADVVITNPTHYAVALKYEPGSEGAPMLIAKGADLVALKIREIATFHKVDVLESPLLARAIYNTTELDQEIPEGLYRAVAQILAYVYQLKAYRNGEAPAPGPLPEIVPPEGYV